MKVGFFFGLSSCGSDLPPFFVPSLKLEFMLKQTVGAYVYYDTARVGKTAIELFSSSIE